MPLHLPRSRTQVEMLLLARDSILHVDHQIKRHGIRYKRVFFLSPDFVIDVKARHPHPSFHTAPVTPIPSHPAQRFPCPAPPTPFTRPKQTAHSTASHALVACPCRVTSPLAPQRWRLTAGASPLAPHRRVGPQWWR